LLYCLSLSTYEREGSAGIDWIWVVGDFWDSDDDDDDDSFLGRDACSARPVI
jgi:hypothetical protein